MPHFVRCIEGHVFDATASVTCPMCGAIVATVSPAVDASASANVTPQAVAVTGSAWSMPLLAAIAALTFAGGTGALIYALHRPGAPAVVPAANSTSKELDKTARSGNSAAPPPTTALPAPPPPSAPANSGLAQAPPATAGQASSTPAPAVQAPAQATQPPATPVTAKISDTLQTDLDLMRTFVAFRAKHYSDVLSMAEPLIARNNPLAMYFKAGILVNGLAGVRDPVQARALLHDAAQLGDPTSLLFMARFLEKGIGGPPEMDTAKRLYIFAAQGMANGADQDITRLRLNGSVGMTALNAYQILVAGTATSQVMQEAAATISNLALYDITPAACLSAQVAPLESARGWKLHDNKTGADLGPDQMAAMQLRSFQFGAQRGDPWCEWGLGELASKGIRNYPKNLVEADVFYRLAALNTRLGADAQQVKQQLAAVESQLTPEEKSQADGLFHGAIPASMAP